MTTIVNPGITFYECIDWGKKVKVNTLNRNKCKTICYVHAANDTYNSFSIGIKGKQMHFNASISVVHGSLTLLFMYFGSQKNVLGSLEHYS